MSPNISDSFISFIHRYILSWLIFRSLLIDACPKVVCFCIWTQSRYQSSISNIQEMNGIVLNWLITSNRIIEIRWFAEILEKIFSIFLKLVIWIKIYCIIQRSSGISQFLPIFGEIGDDFRHWFDCPKRNLWLLIILVADNFIVNWLSHATSAKSRVQSIFYKSNIRRVLNTCTISNPNYRNR